MKRDKQDNYIYSAFLKGDDYHVRNELYAKAKKAVRFYEGDQWYDEKQPDWKKLPFYNFIRPTVDYKVSMVAHNSMAINYLPLNKMGDGKMVDTCHLLNRYIADRWEELKLDTVLWQVVKESAIIGNSYLFFGTTDLEPQVLDSTNVYLADEQESNIQKQRYIIIRERLFVRDVQELAKNCGLPESEVQRIASDKPENQVNNEDNEVRSDDGKVTSLLYISRNENGEVTFARATKTVVYQPETAIPGLRRYPISAFVWNKQHNSARGKGEVASLIPNQIATNRLLLRREVNNKMTGYPHPVYHEDLIRNPEALDKVGSKIIIRGGQTLPDVGKAFGYIQPAAMSNEGTILQNEIIDLSRTFANATDAATGNIDPEQASGKAISLVIDQNAVMLNEQMAMFRQLCEDIALIWLAIWQAYETNGLSVSYFEGDERIFGSVDFKDLSVLQVRVKVDVSPNNPWTVYANDQDALNLFTSNYITFADYVDLLSDQNHMKGKLQKIVEEQQVMAEQQAQLEALMGGGGNVMSALQDNGRYI